MRVRIECRVGVGLVGMLASLAIPCGTALASGSSPKSVPCPVPVPGCPAGPPAPGPGGGGGSGGSGGSGSGPTSAPAPTVPPDQILSDEMSFTQFAYVTRIANIYGQPTTKSRQVGRLDWYTEDGFNSIYLLLRAHWTSPQQEWVKIRIPGRPNGRTGWVQRNALGRFHLTRDALVVNRERMRISFYRSGHQIWNAPVGVGAPSMPTPKGHFWINERFTISSSANGYYPFAFGTTDYSTLTDWPGGGVVGIHGPYGAPASAIPGRISHGCIRLRISDDFWLGRHLQMGTPVRVV